MDERKEFTFEEEDYLVKRPGMKELDSASQVYNKTFGQALNSGAIIRERLEDVLREQGVWNDNKEMKYQTLRREVLDMELKLKRGGMKLSEGRQVALDIKNKRSDMVDMLMARSNLDSNTAEGQADNMRFNYLVSACLVYKKSGKPVFRNLEDYLNRANEPLAVQGARTLYSLLSQQDENSELGLPENKFLLRFEFMNDDGKLVNSDGCLVDEEGRLIDDQGRFIDKDGSFVDIDGNPVTADGEYDVEELPWLDDEGNPVLEEKSSKETEEDQKVTKT